MLRCERMQWENKEWHCGGELHAEGASGREQAPACFHVHTRGHTSVETMCLEVLIADVILICTHPRRHTASRHYGATPQESALGDIWKGQVQHHSNAQAPAHVRTLWPRCHQVSAWACAPHRSSIRRLTSETRISLLPQGLDSKHSFQPAVSQSFGAATHTRRHAQTDTLVCVLMTQSWAIAIWWWKPISKPWFLNLVCRGPSSADKLSFHWSGTNPSAHQCISVVSIYF